MHVAPELVEPLVDPEDGEAFVSQDTVRFKAGPVAKTVYLTYEAVDSRQQKAAGYVTIQILPVDEETNAAPRPRDLVARTLSGTAIDIAVPLDGIDADGDSVELIDISSSPDQGTHRRGRAELPHLRGLRRLDAESTSSSTACATGSARRARRRSASASPRRSRSIRRPYAVKDAVVVRPGREIAVPVMLNDSDPEGDKISLVKNGLEVPAIDGLSARVSGDRVLVQAPDRALETSLQYTVTRRPRGDGDRRAADHGRRGRAAAGAGRARRPAAARRPRGGEPDGRPRHPRERRGPRRHDRQPRRRARRGRDPARERQGAGHASPTSCSSSATRSPTRTDLQSSAFIFVPSVDGLRPDADLHRASRGRQRRDQGGPAVGVRHRRRRRSRSSSPSTPR